MSLADLIQLKEKKPEIARFLEIWSNKNEGRKFDFSSEKDTSDFFEAVVELTKFIISSSTTASFITIPNKDGLETLYVKISPKSLS